MSLVSPTACTVDVAGNEALRVRSARGPVGRIGS